MRASLPAVFFAVLLIAACKEKNIPGLEVQPPSDKLGLIYTDTITVVSYTVNENRIRTDETFFNLLGSYADPIFGIAEASFCTQFLLPVPNLDFGSASVLQADSMVLSLRYTGYYGNTNPQTFKVYELTQDILNSEVYYSNDTVKYNAIEVGAIYNHVPNTTDSIFVDGANRDPHLRIKLKPSFAQKFINASGTSDMSNNQAFTSFFKGLYIKPDNIDITGKGGIFYFQLLSNISKLTLYYTNTSTNTSSSQDFVINELSARFNMFKQNYNFINNSPVTTALNDTAIGKQKVYIQSMGGVKTKIYFPYFKNLAAQGNVIINQAQLVLSVNEDGTGTAQYGPHNRLTLAAARQDGSNAIIIDQLEGDAYFGGTFSAGAKEYRFNITRHMQRLINGQVPEDFGLFILPAGGAVNANRTVLHGSDKEHPKHLKLILTYTKL